MSATLWDIITEHVKDTYPSVPIDHENRIAGGYRFRIRVLKDTIEITDAGKSPGMKAPWDFPRKTFRAADPDLFKKLAKYFRYNGRGGVCVYRTLTVMLQSGWTIEAAPDLMAVHGIDVEQELIGGIAKKIKKDLKRKK